MRTSLVKNETMVGSAPTKKVEFEKAGFLGTMGTLSMIEMPRLRKGENEVLCFVKDVETGSDGKAKTGQ